MICASYFCRVRVNQNFFKSDASHDLIESLRVIGLQARVNVESVKFHIFL